ncbi:low molecular weight phosphotyrosine protein phosphatase [Glaesserella parasuis]|nr:low molecular weight phosphotyrosine protein phosphatase [Glaesserella parasuis]MDO9818114.1 low molecular weight phosphotyrosine protein phosphatase [Glaesserella parasuis]MDO9828719.1 low molecular weight phosphotyrosine protein phosphatase [Glaesserella parasuis]MDP0217102.1 low molecular weight phosphotyrosine protein phosphatase [Glaesserella parasuis]
MFGSILVVCIGNICRSPVGEKLLKQYFPEKRIFSAGISAERSHLVGKGVDPTMQQVAISRGVDLSEHRSQQLTSELCKNVDLILVMEKGHIDLVRQISPESSGKVMLFGHWLDSNKDILDPYRQSEDMFREVYALIEDAALRWKLKL